MADKLGLAICEDCIRREMCSGPQWCEYAEFEDYEIEDSN